MNWMVAVVVVGRCVGGFGRGGRWGRREITLRGAEGCGGGRGSRQNSDNAFMLEWGGKDHARLATHGRELGVGK